VAPDQEPRDERAEPSSAQAPLVEARQVGSAPPSGREAEDRDDEEREDQDADRHGVHRWSPWLLRSATRESRKATTVITAEHRRTPSRRMTTRRSWSLVLESGFPRLGGGVPWPPDGEVHADRRGPQQEEHRPEEAEGGQVQHGQHERRPSRPGRKGATRQRG